MLLPCARFGRLLVVVFRSINHWGRVSFIIISWDQFVYVSKWLFCLLGFYCIYKYVHLLSQLYIIQWKTELVLLKPTVIFHFGFSENTSSSHYFLNLVFVRSIFVRITPQCVCDLMTRFVASTNNSPWTAKKITNQ